MMMSEAAVSGELADRIDRGIDTSRLTLERCFTLDSSSVRSNRTRGKHARYRSGVFGASDGLT
jgi:hypothetical protein